MFFKEPYSLPKNIKVTFILKSFVLPPCQPHTASSPPIELFARQSKHNVLTAQAILRKCFFQI